MNLRDVTGPQQGSRIAACVWSKRHTRFTVNSVIYLLDLALPGKLSSFDRLRPAYTGRLPADLSHATQMNMDKCSANHQ